MFKLFQRALWALIRMIDSEDLGKPVPEHRREEHERHVREPRKGS